MTTRILVGDVRERLAEMPDESVHCVVTSPPYWGLRDYGVAGQLGLEQTLGEHTGVMVAVFAEVRRVLRSDGTVWLNYGDSYATSVNGRSAADTKALGNDDRTFRDKPFSTVGPVNAGRRVMPGGYLKPKDLCGIPWRVAFALQDDGWYLRQDIIWSKPNPMPESIRDRCTKAHEYLFLLAKSPRYYFDAAAIAEPAAEPSSSRPAGARKAEQSADGVVDQRTAAGFARGVSWGETRNRRDVWSIAAEPFPQAHFATFPPALVEPCILAGCPKGGTVLDPFLGSGTTAMVADRLGRDCIGIELNPEYAAMARRRVEQDAGMFARIAAD